MTSFQCAYRAEKDNKFDLTKVKDCLDKIGMPSDRLMCMFEHDVENSFYWWKNKFTYKSFKCESIYKHYIMFGAKTLNYQLKKKGCDSLKLDKNDTDPKLAEFKKCYEKT